MLQVFVSGSGLQDEKIISNLFISFKRWGTYPVKKAIRAGALYEGKPPGVR
jgi:hypothetical protein